jgi:hypothetical protein
MYGLETIQLTQKEMNKIEQIGFVPNEMLRTPPAFIDKTQTNQIVRDHAKSYNVDATEISVVWKNKNSSCAGTYFEGIMQIRLDKCYLDTGHSHPEFFQPKDQNWIGKMKQQKMVYTPSVEWRRTPTKLT